jgi:serine/threonine protein kinase/Tol biopolymer transport system component
MTPERFRQVEGLYHAAREGTADQRVALLAQADPELRCEVESLLAERPGGEFIDRSAIQNTPQLLADSAVSRLAPGSCLGPYRIEYKLGAGGMGEVYRARDTRLDRTVAIKVISDRLAGSPELRERFDREARSIAALNHPHICTLYDVGYENGVAFLVLEYLEGESLADRLAHGSGAGPPLRMDDVLRYAIEVAGALDKAHSAGIVHRDLKPANVFLTKTGSKLLDLGLAKPAPAAAVGAASMLPTTPAALTQTGALLGTFQYMAPEQLEGHEADARSDIFAFGALVYEMVTGRKAFKSTSQASLVAAIMDREPPPLSSLRPEVPAALAWLVTKCLAKDPEERWQSARDLLAQLQFISAGSVTNAAGPKVPLVAPRRRAPFWTVRIALALVAAIAGIIAVRHLLERQVTADRAQFTIAVADNAVLYDAPVLSPDGTRIMIAAADEAGIRQIWVRPLDGLAFQRLAGTEGASYPFWAGDGREIGFFAGGKLKKLDETGGSVVVLCDAINGRGGTWNRDGVIVFSSASARSLFTVSALGGAPKPLGQEGTRTSTAEANPRFPHFLPDGRRFLYFRLTRDAATVGVYLAALDAPDGTRVAAGMTEGAYAQGRIFFQRDGTLMAQALEVDRVRAVGDAIPVASTLLAGANEGSYAFSISENGTLAYRAGLLSLGIQTQLTWVDRSGRTVGTLDPPGSWFNPELSPDGQRVAVARAVGMSPTRDIWMLDVSRGTAGALTSDPGDEAFPLWTPDGRQIVYHATSATRTLLLGDFYRKTANGAGGVEKVFQDGRLKLPASVLSDGRSVVFDALQTGKWQLEIASGSKEPVVLARGLALPTMPTISTDGRWIAYNALGDSGRPEVYVDSFPALGKKRQVSTAGGFAPRWRRDGREIFYLAPDRRLMAVRVTIAGDEIEPAAPVRLFDAAVAGGTVPASDGYALAFRREYDVAADGQRFLLNLVTATSMSMTVATNWTSRLTSAR